ncbi:MAG TPA: hypothetical protein VGS07_01715 [Thermoanaerobaculia bacterium]|jgi:hypothetical protein|nr:hypothetical protein [Thermoanaerobaculia bacterium]
MKLRTLVAMTLLSLVLLALLPWAVSADSTQELTFTNTTNKKVNDLHVEFGQAVTPQPPAGPYGPFTGQSGGGTSKVDFKGGTVAAGGSATITFTSSANQITVKRWWWTLDGRRVGAVQTTTTP